MSMLGAVRSSPAIQILNFSHPLTAEHLAQVKDLTGQEVERVIDVPTQIDPGRRLDEQIIELVDVVGLAPEDWQTQALLINLPGYAPAAAALLAEVHGRMGHFPSVLWIQPVEGSIPRRYRVAEIIDLPAVRDRSRPKRLASVPRSEQ